MTRLCWFTKPPPPPSQTPITPPPSPHPHHPTLLIPPSSPHHKPPSPRGQVDDGVRPLDLLRIFILNLSQSFQFMKVSFNVEKVWIDIGCARPPKALPNSQTGGFKTKRYLTVYCPDRSPKGRPPPLELAVGLESSPYTSILQSIMYHSTVGSRRL
ncbi:hypothetical protein EYF80_028277 [Liparis tanakae]|uniref:Uncharacterized protein n=1 Tax=Liparis tanakae TaxID=230148 RepID=A0A4Z2H9S6_9TELE|nr:hypothetical protein EYF80_028277 [Liparis tanakae]